MDEVKKVLSEGAHGAFATVKDGKPDVRPWQFQFEENGKFYFCTANTKDVYKQLQKTPLAVFSSTTEDMVTIRLSGEVRFVEDPNLKLDLSRRIFDKQPGIKALYQSVENPIFEVFYIENGEVIISDFSGHPPKRIGF